LKIWRAPDCNMPLRRAHAFIVFPAVRDDAAAYGLIWASCVNRPPTKTGSRNA